MQAPQFPDNERDRLKALTELDLLDTPADERFDRITRLTKGLFQVPIALVSLIDENRQWFKSCFGLDVPQTGRDISFCGHAILGEDVFVIEDALLDMRFHDNPLVQGAPFIRFYAGCPLWSPDGHVIGTLCIIDRTKRHFPASDARQLVMLASMIEKELLKVRSISIDEETNVCNKTGFLELAEYSLDIGRQQDVPLSLCTVQLHFDPDSSAEKQTLAIKTLAQISRITSRDIDVFGRVSDERFALLLANCEKDEAEMLIETTLKKVHDELDALRLSPIVTIENQSQQLPPKPSEAMKILDRL